MTACWYALPAVGGALSSLEPRSFKAGEAAAAPRGGDSTKERRSGARLLWARLLWARLLWARLLVLHRAEQHEQRGAPGEEVDRETLLSIWRRWRLLRPPQTSSGLRPPQTSSGLRPPQTSSGLRPPQTSSDLLRPPQASSGQRSRRRGLRSCCLTALIAAQSSPDVPHLFSLKAHIRGGHYFI
ncbi:hypothetical protein EYF80_042384 [Liparis tanakae]|uniref:Uncharacterized protein n=1 Tax=Liparis tanakae TaxID=230148 RepID=A0A4Z2G2F5_9TELE|nr:hypothetical protein EYF80_042384 [Liparis tanakae]